MSDLGIAVVGAGLMGADHITRISERIVGATVTAVVEPDENRAQGALSGIPGARAFSGIDDALEWGGFDAVVIATPGPFHEPVIVPVLQRGLPVLCEKPLTPDPESSLRVVNEEVRGGRQLIQVGFMRRFDQGYQSLRAMIAQGEMGSLLGLHCVHRNPAVPDSYHNDMLIFDSVVHEIDAVRFLTDSPIRSIEVKHMKRNSLSPGGLDEPILVLLRTEDGVLSTVEMNVSVQFGYQVRTEAVFEQGLAEIGRASGLTTHHAGSMATVDHMSFKTRFADAYDAQIQRWVNATKLGRIDGPSAWDGYLAAAAVEAGLEALKTGEEVPVSYVPQPDFYNPA